MLAPVRLVNESVTASSLLSLTGNVGTGAVGTVTLESKYLITGVTATGNVGIVLVYSDVIPSQTPNWTAVTTNTTSWADVTTSQTPNWIDKAA